MKSARLALVTLTLMSVALTLFASEPSDMDGAKTPSGKVVVGYLAVQWGQHKDPDAAKKLVSPNLIEHGYLGAAGAGPAPNAPPTPAAEGGGSGGPIIEIKKVLVQGDLVFVQGLGKRSEQDSGDLMWILYRVKDGKIVEHWDTHNPIPKDQKDKQW